MEIAINASTHINEDPDNPDNEQMARYCPTKGKHILNPIIDWTTEEVWEFIHEYNIPYCKLYDEGYKRLGCIGCPMGSIKHREAEFERYPKFKQAYIRAFDRMIEERSRGGVSKPNQDRSRTARSMGRWQHRKVMEMTAEERFQYCLKNK